MMIYFWILLCLGLCCGGCLFFCLPVCILGSIFAPDSEMFGGEEGFAAKFKMTGSAPEPTGAEKFAKVVKGAANLSLDPLDHLPTDLC